MAEILCFPNKKNDRSLSKLHDEDLIEEHKAKLRNLYAQMEIVVKEINHHKQVLKLLEKGNK